MDLRLIKRRQGFDFVAGKSGLTTVESFETMIPVALFGAVDNWWGNATLLQNEPQQQFTGRTQTVLNKVALNSSGREKIQRAVLADLDFMSDFAELQVSVTLVSVDRVKIRVQIVKPEALQQSEFVYIWDNLEREISEGIGDAPPVGTPPEVNDAFNYDLNFDL